MKPIKVAAWAVVATGACPPNYHGGAWHWPIITARETRELAMVSRNARPEIKARIVPVEVAIRELPKRGK